MGEIKVMRLLKYHKRRLSNIIDLFLRSSQKLEEERVHSRWFPSVPESDCPLYADGSASCRHSRGVVINMDRIENTSVWKGQETFGE